jgi:carbohydrate kinase (thermoresistant glucokinase family)
MIVILMGVSGAGKTAVGERLALRLGWPFHDGDDLHPPANRRKMSAGQPLDDDDRRPWLAAIRDLIGEYEASGGSAIVACSALKETYRRLLLAGTSATRIVYLRGTPELIAERLRGRRGHFFDPALLPTQFAALEEPTGATVVDVDAELDTVVERVLAALDLEQPSSPTPPSERRSE